MEARGGTLSETHVSTPARLKAKALWQEHRTNKEYLVSEGYLAGEDLRG